jgi:hypothetical protein
MSGRGQNQIPIHVFTYCVYRSIALALFFSCAPEAGDTRDRLEPPQVFLDDTGSADFRARK